MNPAFALKNLGDGLQFEIASRWDRHLAGLTWRQTGSLSHLIRRVPVICPFVQILLRGGEAVREKGVNAHARLWKAIGSARVGLLHVFSQGELNAWRRVGELHSFRGRAVAPLQDALPPADRIGQAARWL